MSDLPGWITRLGHAKCPSCGEVKFVSHGPLCPDCYWDRRPCRGRNANVCVAEGCYGEACIAKEVSP